MSNILNIKEIPAWCGLEWSVSWDGRGVVAQPNGIKAIWECAFGAVTKGWRVGFAFEKEAISIDCVTALNAEYASLEYLSHIVQRHGGIKGVAFTHREEAEKFVDDLEKVIMWKLLKREFDE
jgi:hypothetical protein